MVSAKDIVVKPIKASAANDLVRRVHYSGKVVNNSSLHFGAYLDGKLEGAMSFGSPLDKRKVLPLVEGTAWTGMLELNRMAFSDRLPRNSESRCIAVAFRLIKKHYPHVEWVLSFSDGTQCGDGTIYRASGFVLTQIKNNTSMWQHKKTGERRQDMQFFHTGTLGERKSGDWFKVPGFQLRYIYFIDPTARERLTVPILPFSEISKRGAGMYLGKSRASSIEVNAPVIQTGEGGSIPTLALQLSKP